MSILSYLETIKFLCFDEQSFAESDESYVLRSTVKLPMRLTYKSGIGISNEAKFTTWRGISETMLMWLSLKSALLFFPCQFKLIFFTFVFVVADFPIWMNKTHNNGAASLGVRLVGYAGIIGFPIRTKHHTKKRDRTFRFVDAGNDLCRSCRRLVQLVGGTRWMEHPHLMQKTSCSQNIWEKIT